MNHQHHHTNSKKPAIPKSGWTGIRENFSADALSGFLVFLLALPLSLGIAKASDFPAIMGLITAMVGGIVAGLISGAPLTIKGPAAGLIVIVAGAVSELGRGDSTLGWHLALGAIVVAGLVQIVFSLMKLGSFVDFFPLSAVHGMLAAIGIIIMSKQLHVLLGVNPVGADGRPLVEPLSLFAALPATFASINSHAAIVGIVSLAIVFLWPRIKHPLLKKIPAPFMVLLIAIPLSRYLHLQEKLLIHFDKNLFDVLALNESFDGFSQMGTFIKYVLMFALVGSLESLLTVKAIDMLDPWKRKARPNKDLMSVGIGNVVAGFLGGLPMISEVARSSANVNNGGRTRMANIYHGIFILIFLILDIQFSDLIPNAALAAMLIGVGFKLANPREFGLMVKIGIEQLIIFCTTIVVTLATDLLVGMAAGILVKFITHAYHGVPLKYWFKANVEKHGHTLKMTGAAVFSNYLGLKKHIEKYQPNEKVTLDFSGCQLVDHTVIDNLHHLKLEYGNAGGELNITGLEDFRPLSKANHHLSALKKVKA